MPDCRLVWHAAGLLIMQNITLFFWVALGGGLGSTTRFMLSHSVGSGHLTTLLINVLGAGLMGYLFMMLELRLRKDGQSRLPKKLAQHTSAKALYEKDMTLQAVDHFRSRKRLSILSAFLLTGFLGGFTTFSAYSLFNVILLQQANYQGFFINLVITPLLAFACFLTGCFLAFKTNR
ncbi:MAG: CrcB family protein [Cellvibrionales bacterium]|nr:CrcB family protein [Cellvibrionales bacterium]